MKLSSRLNRLAATSVIDATRVDAIQDHLNSYGPECASLSELLATTWEKFAEGPLLEPQVTINDARSVEYAISKPVAKGRSTGSYVEPILSVLAASPSALGTAFLLVREAHSRNDQAMKTSRKVRGLRFMATPRSKDLLWPPLPYGASLLHYVLMSMGRRAPGEDDPENGREGSSSTYRKELLAEERDWNSVSKEPLDPEAIASSWTVDLGVLRTPAVPKWIGDIKQGESLDSMGLKNPFTPYVQAARLGVGVKVSMDHRSLRKEYVLTLPLRTKWDVPTYAAPAKTPRKR